jgi:hypothetical protein
MPTVSEVILEAAPGENARIGLNVEERVPLRWYRKGLDGLRVPVIAVCRFEERRVGLPHAFVGVAPDDTPAAAEIEAPRTVAKSEQGRRGPRETGFHEDAPCRGFGRRRGNADPRSLGGEGLVSQGRVRFTGAPIGANLRGIRVLAVAVAHPAFPRGRLYPLVQGFGKIVLSPTAGAPVPVAWDVRSRG